MKNLWKTIKPILVKREPEIFIGLGVVSLIGSVVGAIAGTTRAVKAIDIAKEEKGEDLTKKEAFQAAWKYYIPTATTSLAGVFFIIFGTKVSTSRSAAAVAAYTLAETSLIEYKDKAKKIFGEEAAQKVQDSITEDKVKETPLPSKIEQYICEGDGDVVIFEPLSKRYIISTWDTVYNVQNIMNANALASGDDITLFDWCYEIGIPFDQIPDTFSEIGWRLNNGRKSIIDIRAKGDIYKGNRPCLAIEYYNEPEYLKKY